LESQWYSFRARTHVQSSLPLCFRLFFFPVRPAPCLTQATEGRRFVVVHLLSPTPHSSLAGQIPFSLMVLLPFLAPGAFRFFTSFPFVVSYPFWKTLPPAHSPCLLSPERFFLDSGTSGEFPLFFREFSPLVEFSPFLIRLCFFCSR